MKEKDTHTILPIGQRRKYSRSELDEKQDYDGSENEEDDFYSFGIDQPYNLNEDQRMRSPQ